MTDQAEARAALDAVRERCCEIVLKCADQGILSWNAAQEINAAIKADALKALEERKYT